MIKSVTIIKPTGEQYFEVGAKILREKKETDITVISIKEKKGIIVMFSNKERLIFRGLPYIIAK